MNYLENKEIATIRTITGELIGGFLLYGIPFAILYSIIYGLISNVIPSDSLILLAIIAIILQGLTVILIWKCSIATTFRKRAIARSDVPTVIRNLIIFTIILCLLNGIINFSRINSELDEIMNSSSFINYIYENEELSQYQEEIEKTFDEAKTKSYTYLAVLEVGLLIVYLGAVPLQKNSILKHAV